MIDFLMEGIVVWQIAPDEEPVILNGEIGIPYILPDGGNWLAIMKDGQVIDSISIDITKRSNKDVIVKTLVHNFDFWDDGSERLIANPSAVKKAMRNRAVILSSGWSYESAWDVLFSVVDKATNNDDSDALIKAISYLGGKNIDAVNEFYILSQAAEAYELYMTEFDSKKRIKQQANSTTGIRESFEVMYLSLLISLINPCANWQWENEYNRQGARSQDMPQNRLTVTIEVLQEKVDNLLRALYLMETLDGCNDPEEIEDVRSEIAAVQKALEILTEENNYIIIKRKFYILAIKTAKALITLWRIPCGTNTVEQEWTKFVATAWEVTPSQVVSAAKALKKLESHEQK